MSANPKEIMHAEELNAWLKRFESLSGRTSDEVITDIEAIWQSNDAFLNSQEIAEALFSKYLSDNSGLTPQAKKVIARDFADAQAIKRLPDHVTGTLKKEHKGVETALAHLYASRLDKPVAMFEFDYGNMGGTNEYFQRLLAIKKLADDKEIINPKDAALEFENLSEQEQNSLISAVEIKETFAYTDMAAKIVAQSIVHDFKNYYPDLKVTAIRTGGDELRFIVDGLEQQDYTRAIGNINYNIESKMAKLNLLDHEHAKGRDNPFKNGFGGGMSAIDMRDIHDPENIIAELDERIKEEKTRLGEIRLGRFSDLGALTEQIKSNLNIPLDENEITAEQSQALTDAIEKQENALKSLNEHIRGYTENAPQNITDYELFSRALLEKIDQTPSSLLTANQTKFATPDTTNTSLPLTATIEDYRMHYLVEERFASYIVENDGNDIADEVSQFMIDVVSELNPIDPSAQVHTPADLARNIDLWNERMGDQNSYSMFVGFHNLGGLNNLLGHDGADAVLKHMSQIVESSLASADITDGDYLITHNGGGEYRLLLSAAYAPKTQEIEQEIAAKTEALNQKQIVDFLDEQGIDLSDKQRQELADKRFSEVIDPKIRDVNLDGQKLQGRINGLAVVCNTLAINIDNTQSNPELPWSGGKFLAQAKEALEANIETFRNEQVLAQQGAIDQSAQCNNALSMHEEFDKANDKNRTEVQSPKKDRQSTAPDNKLNCGNPKQ